MSCSFSCNSVLFPIQFLTILEEMSVRAKVSDLGQPAVTQAIPHDRAVLIWKAGRAL